MFQCPPTLPYILPYPTLTCPAFEKTKNTFQGPIPGRALALHLPTAGAQYYSSRRHK